MARIRSLKPGIFQSPQVMNLSMGARLLFVGLITQACDQGRGTADARSLRAAVFPGDDCSSAEVDAWLGEIEAQGLIVVYDGPRLGRLYALPTWNRHQRINRPTPSHYPAPPNFPDQEEPCKDSSLNTHGVGSESSVGIGEEGEEGKEGGSAPARPPLTDRRRTMAAEIAAGCNAAREWDAFLDHRAASGELPEDWDAAWRSWLRKVRRFGPAGGTVDQAQADEATEKAWKAAREYGQSVGFRPPHGRESPAVYRTQVDLWKLEARMRASA